MSRPLEGIRILAVSQFGAGPYGSLMLADQGVAALINDLDARGLLDTTLVLLLGEFGRTPKVNQRGGRDHYPRAMFTLLAGGGIKNGQVVGASDEKGELVSRLAGLRALKEQRGGLPQQGVLRVVVHFADVGDLRAVDRRLGASARHQHDLHRRSRPVCAWFSGAMSR